MKRLCLSMLLMCLAGPLWGQTIELPAEIKGDVAAFVRVAAKTDGTQVRWVSLDSGLSVFPSDLLRDSKTTVVVAQKPGKYRLIAYTAKGDVPSEPAATVVVIGTPGPDPGPTPPPAPDDPLTKALQAAFDRETDTDKARLKGSLAALYRQGAEVTARQDVTTWGQLFDVMKTAATTLGVSGKLPALQAAIADELKTRFPTDRAKVLTVDDRVLAASTLRRVATALEGVR